MAHWHLALAGCNKRFNCWIRAREKLHSRRGECVLRFDGGCDDARMLLLLLLIDSTFAFRRYQLPARCRHVLWKWLTGYEKSSTFAPSQSVHRNRCNIDRQSCKSSRFIIRMLVKWAACCISQLLITWCRMRLLFSLQMILLLTYTHNLRSHGITSSHHRHLTADFNSLYELGTYKHRQYREMCAWYCIWCGSCRHEFDELCFSFAMLRRCVGAMLVPLGIPKTINYT